MHNHPGLQRELRVARLPRRSATLPLVVLELFEVVTATGPNADIEHLFGLIQKQLPSIDSGENEVRVSILRNVQSAFDTAKNADLLRFITEP